MKKPKACVVSGCGGKVIARGLCNKHYCKAKYHGDLGLFDRVISNSIEDAMIRYAPSGLAPDECWPWTGYVNDAGYGQFRSGGKLYRAHRVALARSGVEVPDSAFVLHSCDRPSCVNPNHLRVGTLADNNRDIAIRERSFHIKVSNADVLKIRELRGKITNAEIAARFGLRPAQVSAIQTGRERRHV